MLFTIMIIHTFFININDYEAGKRSHYLRIHSHKYKTLPEVSIIQSLVALLQGESSASAWNSAVPGSPCHQHSNKVWPPSRHASQDQQGKDIYFYIFINLKLLTGGGNAPHSYKDLNIDPLEERKCRCCFDEIMETDILLTSSSIFMLRI